MKAIRPTDFHAFDEVPDVTPGLIAMHAKDERQLLLAAIRHDRLMDIFTGLPCCSLQQCLRGRVRGLGEVETDEVYIGVARRGMKFVFPVQARTWKQGLRGEEARREAALCAKAYPSLTCRPIGAVFVSDDVIALIEFQDSPEGTFMVKERHYRLVPITEFPPER